ncbi:putative membrane transporter protein [Candidatus Hydrogenisulfobacillus filiaventi]|uniref:Probable membrane transporter protein n=1 Tax=Candidatus Hydrogenisulfobacillus filiaventi TaxID=2707344 RepID=A0A6F8ZGN3_9FIRM|nr:TSUP family transporter [Bacillota bacterium]CAB1128796.1 putative membrane transporter protein [Candidatus Hydrogenisulfobacillus filiaventi]
MVAGAGMLHAAARLLPRSVPLPALVGAGMLAGLGFAWLGSAGAVLATPLLMLGVPARWVHRLMGLHLLLVVLGGLSGLVRRPRLALPWHLLRRFLLPALAALAGAAWLGPRLGGRWLWGVLAAALVWQAVALWRPGRPSRHPGLRAALVGGLMGLAGAGAGLFVPPALAAMGPELPVPVLARGSLVITALLAGGSAGAYVLHGWIRWRAALWLLAASGVGSALGGRLEGRGRLRRLQEPAVYRRLVGWLCLAAGVMAALRGLGAWR